LLKLFKRTTVELEFIEKLVILTQCFFFSFVIFSLGFVLAFNHDYANWFYRVTGLFLIAVSAGNMFGTYKILNYRRKK
jgi:cytochrome c biogenesis protein CcdA